MSDWPLEGLSETAKEVVGVAVELSLRPRDAFDYGIFTGNDRCLHWLEEALIDVACRDLPPLTAGVDGATPEQCDARHQERQQATRALKEQLGGELVQYQRRCQNSQYTGWSKASRQPIQRENPIGAE